MESVIVTESEVVGNYVEGVRIEEGLKMVGHACALHFY